MQSVYYLEPRFYARFMKYTSIIIIVILPFTFICNGQSDEKPKLNALSFELGKTGLIYNLSFDHKLASKNVGYRISVGSNLEKYLNLISIGAGGYYLVGSKNKFFELGLDIQYLSVVEVSDDQLGFASIFVYPNYSINTIYPSLNIGYRRYRKKSLFRIGFSPGLIRGELIPGGYISLGVRF